MSARDCTTCEWGVVWDDDILDPTEIHGRCQWKCPVPHPREFGLFASFSSRSKPVVECPAYALAKHPERNPRWCERREDWVKRLEDIFEVALQKYKDEEQEMLRAAVADGIFTLDQARSYGLRDGMSEGAA